MLRRMLESIRTAAWLSVLFAPLALGTAHSATPTSQSPDTRELQQWVEQMKQSPRGPFEAVRWFCADGTVQPPKAYACADHGGGIQHGLWSERVQRMRDESYNFV